MCNVVKYGISAIYHIKYSKIFDYVDLIISF